MPDDPGSMLVDAGLIGADQLAWARRAQAEAGGTLGEHLVLAGHVDDDALAELYRARLRVPRVSEEELARIGPKVLRRIPADMAAELRVLPLATDGEQNLTVAMSDPSDQHAVDEVAFFTGCYVVRAVATQAQIAWGLAHYYGVMTPLWSAAGKAGGGDAAGGVPAAVLEEAPTGPARARTVRQPLIDRDALERELAPRSGEITAQAPPPEPERLPAVVIEPIEEGDPERPILLERRARRSSGDAPDGAGDGSDEGVVLLDQSMRRRRRTSRQTQPGIGRLGAVDSRRERVQDTDVSLKAPWGDGEREEEDAVSRSEESHSKSGQSSAQTRSAPPPPARSAPVSVDDGWELDDGWGPPGTTIPPAYLGATPKALEEEAPSGRIPLQVSDEGTGEVIAAENAEAAPVAAPDEDTARVAGAAAVAAAPAPEPVDPAVLAAELERSSNRLLETVRKLERAPSRDDVIDVLLDHLGGLCQRRAFFAIKGGALHPFKQQGAARPGVGTGALALSEPSTFSQVASSRLPYHGVVSPEGAEFVAGALGSPPEGEAVVIPILLRGRAIALLYGDGISGRVFDEHQMVLGRAAGQALERILVSQKSS